MIRLSMSSSTTLPSGLIAGLRCCRAGRPMRTLPHGTSRTAQRRATEARPYWWDEVELPQPDAGAAAGDGRRGRGGRRVHGAGGRLGDLAGGSSRDRARSRRHRGGGEQSQRRHGAPGRQARRCRSSWPSPTGAGCGTRPWPPSRGWPRSPTELGIEFDWQRRGHLELAHHPRVAAPPAGRGRCLRARSARRPASSTPAELRCRDRLRPVLRGPSRRRAAPGSTPPSWRPVWPAPPRRRGPCSTGATAVLAVERRGQGVRARDVAGRAALRRGRGGDQRHHRSPARAVARAAHPAHRELHDRHRAPRARPRGVGQPPWAHVLRHEEPPALLATVARRHGASSSGAGRRSRPPRSRGPGTCSTRPWSRSIPSWRASVSNGPGEARSALTADRFPHVGRHPDTGVVYAMGYCGSGVALSVHFGRAVGRWLCGRGDLPAFAGRPWPAVPWPAHVSRALLAGGRAGVPGARRAGALSGADRGHGTGGPQPATVAQNSPKTSTNRSMCAVVVLHRQRPLLLVARRHEDAPVHEPRPRGVEEIGVGLEEAPVVDQGLGAGTTRSPCSPGR